MRVRYQFSIYLRRVAAIFNSRRSQRHKRIVLSLPTEVCLHNKSLVHGHTSRARSFNEEIVAVNQGNSFLLNFPLSVSGSDARFLFRADASRYAQFLESIFNKQCMWYVLGTVKFILHQSSSLIFEAILGRKLWSCSYYHRMQDLDVQDQNVKLQ